MSFAFQQPTDEEGINLIPQGPTLPAPTIDARAARADYALGDQSPGHQNLKDMFATGQEQTVREQAARQANNDFKEQKLAAVNDAISKGAPVTPQEIDNLVNIGTTPEANPKTVFEDKFAKNVVTTGIAGDPSKNLVFQSAFEKAPDETNTGARMAMGAVSRKYQAKGVQEEVEAAYNALPFISVPALGIGSSDQQDKFGNMAKNFLSLGFATYVNQRNLLTSDPIQTEGAWLPGSNKLAQIQYLYGLPHDQFRDALMAAAGPDSPLFKKSPSDAVDFVKSAVQFSTSDAYVDNLFGVVNVASLLPASTVLRVIRGFGRGAVEAGVATAAESVTPKVRPEKPTLVSGRTTAEDILGQSSAPPTPGYYIPQAAVKRPWETQSRMGSFEVKDGVPKYFTDDGAEVQVSRTPEVGMVKIEPQEGTPSNTYRTKQGTFEFSPEGVEGRRTIYVNEKDYTRLSQVLDEENPNLRLLDDDKGFYVNDKAKSPEGKEIKGSRVPSSRISTEPAEGLYPIHIPEGNDKLAFGDFGSKIERVDRDVKQNWRFGHTIVEPEEKDARVALADITKSQGYTHPQDVLSKMGQHEAAAEVGAQEAIQQDATQTFPLGDLDAIRRRIPSIAQPSPYYDGGSSLSWKRLIDIYDEFKGALKGTRVERMTPTAMSEALTVARQAVRKYNRMSVDAIRDQVTKYDVLTNTYSVETKIGLPNGQLFASRAQATHYKNMQYRMGSSATVEQEGTEFYLSHVQHADETQSIARKALVLDNNQTPQSFVNAFIGRLKSAASTLSEFQRAQRETATMAQSFLRNAIDKEAETLGVLNKKFNKTEKHELNDILIHNRDYIPPGGTGKDRGFFYKSQHEFENGFLARIGHLPSEAQWNAYEAYTRLSDLDWVLRESEVFRDKARLGLRNYRFSFVNREGKNVQTEFLSGKEVPDFHPMVHANANIYVLPENKFLTKNDLKDNSPLSKSINDKIKSGEYKIIQVYDPRSKPLLDTTGIKDDIHFVVTNKFDERAVQFGENVPYRPGGHVIYLGQHYIKQPQIGSGTNGQLTHFGDVSLKAFETRREAEFWAERYNIAREHLKNGRQADFDNYVTANLPETPAELRRMFNDKTFNLDHPFMYTHAGRDTLQSNEAFVASNPAYQGLKDTFSAYNLKQTQDSAFLADRGVQLNTIEKAGTMANPIYNNVPAPLLDPYSSLNKGLSQIVRARWMTDYKHMAAESWIQEFGHFFDQSKLPIERLRMNPWYYINHLDAVDRAKMLANPEAYAAMKTSRANILRFVGTQDEVGGMINALNARLADKIADKVGDKAAVFAENTGLPFIQNVPQYMRRATFDLVDGLGNYVQIFQQALGATHAFAISPTNAFKATAMSYIGRRMARTEDVAIHDAFLNQVAKMGWTRDDAKAAFDAWRETGVHNVGGEVSQLSELDNPTLFKTYWGQMIDKGRYFFKKGEQVNRDIAFFTAFKDWRDANPTRVVDNRARTEMMARFSTLYMNMDRASNTFYNEGLLSIPSQFWTWNARFAEQMMTFGAGRQLTIAEKGRVLALNSLLWGAPSAIGGATLGLLPYLNYDDVRQYALDNNINVSDKFFQAFSEGIPTMVFNTLTGHETSLHRFSPNADQLKVFTDLQTGKKDLFEVVFGASGSMVEKLFAAAHPFWAYSMSAFSKEGGFPIKMNDLVNAAENIRTFDMAERAWVAWSTGRYVSKNEQLQANDIDKFESIMLGLGLTPQRVNDAWSMKAVEQGRKSAQSKLEKRILEDSAIAFRAAQDGDLQTYNDYMARVHTWTAMGNFTHREEKAIWKKAIHGQESLVDNVNKQWLERHPQMQEIPQVQKYFENLRGKQP